MWNRTTCSVSPPREGAGLFDLKGGRKYLNAAEQKAFADVVRKEADAQVRLFLWTLLCCGCRISEALQLTWDRVDLAEKTLVFETLKRRKKGLYRAVPIPEFMVEEFNAIAMNDRKPQRVWTFSRTTGYRIVKRAMGEAGITGTRGCPKGLRHAFAMAAVNKAIPLSEVQKWMGHASPQTTAIYLDFKGEEERKMASRIWENF